MTTTIRLSSPELRLARRQHGVVTRRQLLDAGLSAAAIRHRLDHCRLHRVHPGVYAVGRPDLTQEGRWLAAVLACGRDAALSHRSAGRLWGILERGGTWPEVAVPTQSGIGGPRGVTVHRCATLSPEDVVLRSRVRITALPRTLLDLAGAVDRRTLRAAVRRAVALYDLDLRSLRAFADEPRRDPRRARMRAVIDRYVPRSELTESELEARLLELCARHRLPLPLVQVRVAGYRADFMWPDARVIVETDGGRWHDTIVGRGDDHERDRALRAAGYEVLRFTWADVVNRPGMVARDVRRALARAR